MNNNLWDGWLISVPDALILMFLVTNLLLAYIGDRLRNIEKILKDED